MSEQASASIKRQLSALRQKLSIVLTEGDELLSETTPSRIDISEIITDLESLHDEYKKKTDILMDCIADEEVDDECATISNDDKKVRYLIRRLKKSLPASCSVTVNNQPNSAKIKMPTLELPKFEGDVLKFLPFWEQFRCAVDDVKTLSLVQKFVYLRTSLTGPALECISGYEVTESNYPLAVEALTKRFGKRRVIIAALVKSMLSLQQNSSSAKDLREFSDRLQGRVRTLESQGLDVQNSSVRMLLLPWFEEKLLPDMLKEWELEICELDEDKLTMKRFFSFLDRQVSAQEATKRVASHEDYDHPLEYPETTTSALVSQNPLPGGNPAPVPVSSNGLLSASAAAYRPRTSFQRPDMDNQLRPRPAYVTPQSQNFIGYRHSNTTSYQHRSRSCSYCGLSSHEIERCRQFTTLPAETRWKWAQSSRKCYCCLRFISSGHSSSTCTAPGCNVQGCGQKHHPLLHPPYPTHGVLGSVNDESPRRATILQTAKARLCVEDREVIVRVLLDTGSQRSYLRRNIAESLHLKGPIESLAVSTLGGTTETKAMPCVPLTLRPVHGSPKTCIDLHALVISEICEPLEPSDIDPNRYEHLRELELSEDYPSQRSKVDLLIGLDYYYDVVDGGRCRRGGHGTPIAIDSRLGWILCGYSNNPDPTITALSAVVDSRPDDENLSARLDSFWSLESIGIGTETTPPMADNDQAAMKHFEETTIFNGARYVVKIPWKPLVEFPRDNYSVAEKRLFQLETRLRKDPAKAEDYRRAIDQYASDGVAEEVTEPTPSETFVHYFAHHAVYRNEKATTKTRIVMDGSLRGLTGFSLNDCMYSGPALQPDQFAILIRWRTHKVALISDVKKMFLQVELDESDRDSHRYLWRDLDTTAPPRIYRFKRVTFGVAASPFLAIATVQHHARVHRNLFPLASKEILNNMFVDDCLSGSYDVSSAIRLKAELLSLMKIGGFELTKWVSNSEDVMKTILVSERNPSFDVNSDQSSCLKALGVTWNPQADVLKLDITPVLDSVDKGTKRSTLSLIAKFYDPFGFSAPFTISAKLLMREIWLHGKNWDEKLAECCESKWVEWKSQLATIQSMNLPRWLPVRDDGAMFELHCFSDASISAYGAVVYCRTIGPNGFCTGFIMSKNRVAPIKRVTLPRLELLGIVIGARLTKFVSETFNRPPTRIVCWSDSQVALHWIKKAPHELKTFVGNRVEQVQDILSPEHFHFCPGTDNPADLLTRGLSAEKLIDSQIWWNGPSWLRQDEANWPAQPDNGADLQELVCEEHKPSSPQSSNTRSYVTTSDEFENTSAGFIRASDFSKWSKLRRVTAFVLLPVDRFRKRCPIPDPPILSVEMLHNTDMFWLKHCQNSTFSEEMTQLQEGKLNKAKSSISKLDPYMDEKGLIRVGGRLEHASIPADAKHQIILPHHNWITKLIIEHEHRRASHVGIENTHAILRQKFWIIHGKQELKRVLHTCLPCLKQTAKPYSQKMANLPSNRLSVEPSFSVVGVDFAGPLYIRSETGGEPAKVYICLFTCANSRMLHLELVNNQSTESFMNAWRRMVNRRGMCHTIWSDNALTFKAADRTLRLLFSPNNATKMNLQSIRDSLIQEGVSWKFITERGPWHGGFYERLVRSVKSSLRKVLGRALLSHDELHTVLTDIEAAINSRPLTAISDDIKDENALTPAHLTIGRSLTVTPDLPQDHGLVSISDRYLYVQRLLNLLWKRWVNEYLPLLTVRQKWLSESPPCKVGDLVLVSDDGIKRCKWPLGRVIELFEGRDGLIRSVMVRTARGQIKRPVQRLHKLESDIE